MVTKATVRAQGPPAGDSGPAGRRGGRRYTPAPVKATVEPLEGNKVKLSVEVEEDEFERALDDAFKRIAAEVRIPGFRPGKAPRRILEARIGNDVARQEALREALPEYYARAVDEHDVDAIAPPEIDITGGQEGGPVQFEATVEVRPRIEVAGYQNLRVEVPSPQADEAEIDEQVDRLRKQSGELQAVERPAVDGDHVTIDIAGSVGGEPVEGLQADDYLYEVGTGAVVPEIDDHLRGGKVGDILVFEASHPDPDVEDPISFRVLVKDVKEQVLPDADDEWASEASEFETLEELRADLRERIGNIKRVQAQLSLRQGVVDRLVELVADEPPEALVQGEIERRLNDIAHRLQHQGATIQQWLEATGQSVEDLVGELRADATTTVKADLAIRAVIEAEEITADDDEVDAEIERLAQRFEQEPDQLRKELERAGRMSAVRSDVQRSKALEWLAERAEVVDPDGTPVDRALLEPPAENDQEAAEEQE
jgi:trigger factor